MVKATTSIPMLDLQIQYKQIHKEIDKAVKEVLESTQFIMGPAVKTFEQEMSVYCDTQYAISCNSGTDALQIALMALDVQPGDEVITTPFTFVATAEVIRLLGAKSVFVDIDPVTYNINPSLIEKAITQKTKAIIPVHLYGQIADMDAINTIADKHHVPVIEDACQAIGATYKGKQACSLGLFGCLSFFPSKNLGAYGDGGMILTSDQKMAELCQMIRNHGSKVRYVHEVLGVNSRLDSLQAAILSVRLRHLNAWNEARKDRAALYNELLGAYDVVTPFTAETNEHVYHQYSIRVKNRDGLKDHLGKAGIASAIHYPIPLHLQPAFQDKDFPEGSLPVSEAVAKDILSLPMYPELKEEDIVRIVDTIAEFID